jgi:hypothetical protein
VALGCKPPPSKMQFNNRMAEANKAMGKEAASFRKALFPSGGKDFDPDKVDRSSLHSAYDRMKKELTTAQSRFEDPDLPRRSSAAEGMKSAYVAYLKEQQNILDKAKEIVDAVEDSRLDRGEKLAKVLGLLDKIQKAEDEVFKELEGAQQKYSEAHNFRVVMKLD